MALILSTTTVFDHDYYPADAVGLEFLNALKETAGNITVGDASAVGEYNAATAATLSDMIADAEAFLLTGIQGASDTAAVAGFSTTTPKSFFDSYRSDAASTGNWSGTGTDGLDWAKCIRSCYAVGTASLKARALAVWQWLIAFTSNPALEDNGTIEAPQMVDQLLGDYDPHFCLARSLDTANRMNATSGGNVYQLACIGLLAQVTSENDRANFKDVKEELSKKRRYYDDPDGASTTQATKPTNQYLDLYLFGLCGLQFQLNVPVVINGNSTFSYDATFAAYIGDAYRRAPIATNRIDR